MSQTKEKTFLPEVIAEKVYEFELAGPYKPVNYGISSQCVVYDPVLKEETHIKYVPGWKTIIVADQPEVEERLMPHIDINFSYGKLRVSGQKKQYVQFLLLHDKREGNELSITKEAQFRLVDNTGELKGIRDLISKRGSAIDKASELPFEEVLPFAKVRGINTGKIAGEKQAEYEERVRTKFMQDAEKDPAGFLDGLADPAHKRKYDVILGFEQGVITDNIKDGEINWAVSGEKIVILPPGGADVREFLAKFTLTDKGAEFYNQLKKQVKY